MQSRPPVEPSTLTSITRTHFARLIVAVLVMLSPQLAQAIARPSVTLNISPGSSVVAGTTVILTATVMDGSNPVTRGLVVFCDANSTYCEDGAIVGTAQLTGGSATFRLVPGVGSYSIKAIFEGVTSTPQPVTVSGDGSYLSATTIAAMGTAANYTLTATVSAFGREAPTGTVSFLDSSNSNSLVGSATLDQATLGSKLIALPGSTTAIGAQPGSVAEGDFNNDGIVDLAVANSGEGTISVLLGRGDGTFRPQVKFATGRSPHAIAVGDFNGDGSLDVVAANRDDNSLSVLLGNGDGTFQAQTTYATGNTPLGVAVADFNADGNADVVVANATDNTISVLLGNGDGTFQTALTSPAGSSPYGIALGDFNRDGIVDVAVASSADNSVSVLLGNDDGTFQPQAFFAVGNTPLYAVAVDLNGDGIPDLVAANYKDNTVSVLLGNGDGSFQNALTYAAGSGAYILASADFNADGKIDLAATNFNDNTVSVYLGNGDGTLQPQVRYAVGRGASGLATGDFTGDGLPDLAATNYTDGTVSVLLAQVRETATATGISVLGVGTHNVVASYPGDASRAASQSSSVPLTGLQTTTATALKGSPNPAMVGQAVTLAATVTPAPTGAPTGTMEFYNGTRLLGTAPVNSSGVATLVISNLPIGSDSVTAAYSGNYIFAASTSSAVVFTIQAAPTFRVTAPQTPVTVTQGGSAKVTVTVAPVGGTYSGVVTMSASGMPSGTTVSFNKPTVIPGSAGQSTVMTIQTSTQVSSLQPRHGSHFPLGPISLAAGICLISSGRKLGRKRLALLFAAAALVAGTLVMAGCQGLGAPKTQTQSYGITVTGTSGSLQSSTTVTVIVQ
jgi:hypothetical protein